MSLEDRFEALSDEMKEKAKACNSPEELMALVEEGMIELSDEELEAISGGSFWVNSKCPQENCS